MTREVAPGPSQTDTPSTIAHRARRGSLVDARRSDPTLADVEIGSLWHACRALSRIADALEETGAG